MQPANRGALLALLAVLWLHAAMWGIAAAIFGGFNVAYDPALGLRVGIVGNQTAALAVDLIESLFGKTTLMRASSS